jgi:hypothetical protein
MPGVEVTVADFKKRLTESQRLEVDAHLAAGRSVACYEDERGFPALIITHGTRDSDVPGLPPSNFGRGALHSYVFAPQAAQPKRSPLMDYEAPRQIARPRVSPSMTSHPDVQIEMRTSSHPRGNSEYITPLLPGREPEPVLLPPEPLTPDQRWYQDHVR